MFAIERQRMIKKLLTQNRHVSVTELSLCLNVSEVTVRRDLEKLEGERFLMRTHGGAVIRDETTAAQLQPEAEEAEYVDDQIQRIARLGVDLVQNGSIIYLDSGPVCAAMAQLIGEKQDVIVLTCSLPIALELRKKPELRVVLPGGELQPNGLLYGPMTQNVLNSLHIGTAFIEPTGFSQSGFTMREQMTGSLIQTVGSISDQAIFLCAPQAYGHISFFPIGDLSIADSIITAAEVDDSFKDACRTEHIKLFTSFSL